MAASWLKGYLQASFRGVEFFIKRAANTGGRRLAKHVFPESEVIEYEDLGPADSDINLTAYIIGDNYFQHREDLLKALNTKGPGTLIHPYRGTFQVVCHPYEEFEDTAEGRVARFGTLRFSVVDIEDITKVTANTLDNLRSSKQSLLDSVLEWFEDAYTIANKPTSFINDAVDKIDEGLQVVDAAKTLANTQAEFRRAIGNLEGRAIVLSLDAKILFDSFSETINYGTNAGSALGFNATADNSKEQFREMTKIAREINIDNPGGTGEPDYPAQQIQDMIILNAVAATVGLMSTIEFDSVQEAEEFGEIVYDLIDAAQLSSELNDGIFESLRDAKAAVFADLESRSIILPRLVDFNTKDTRNTLFISYSIYGSLDNEEDINLRNDILHPGFITDADTLQVKINE